MGIQWLLMYISLCSIFGMVCLDVTLKQVFAIEGKNAVLPCSNEDSIKSSFRWKHKDRNVVQNCYNTMLQYGTGYSKDRINTENYDQFNYSIKLLKVTFSDGGIYKCTTCSKDLSQVQLHIIKVISPDGGQYLQSMNVKLKCIIEPLISENIITWLNPNREPVSGSDRYQISDGGKTLEIKEVQVQESGQWACRVEDVNADYTVQVLGITDNSQSAMAYASENQSVILPFKLTQDIKHSTFGNSKLINGELLRSKEEGRDHSVLISLISSQQNLFWEETSTIRNQGSGRDLSIQLMSVSFQDAGRYIFKLTFDKGTLQKNVDLVIMQVTASFKGKVSSKDTVNVTCQVSSNKPPLRLVWQNMNKTRNKQEGEVGAKYLTISLSEETADQFDVWRCSLMKESEVKVSVEYTLEPDEGPDPAIPQWVFYSAGGLALLLLFIIGFALFCTTTNHRRQRRARRISMMKRVLDPQQTCQCHKVQYELYRS